MFKCLQCDEEYEDEADLYMHLIFTEGNGIEKNKKFVCNLCDKTYDDENDLGIHIAFRHKLGEDKDTTEEEVEKVVLQLFKINSGQKRS